MRVVAGSAGGRTLEVPRGDTVRPTMDRVKAAIFSSLGDLVPGARVLDLFAGSGGLGIEALSRGSVSAVFVERDREAVDAIKCNLAKTGLTGEVRCSDVFDFLERATGVFDLIFADPPYAKAAGERDFGADLLHSSTLPRALAAGGMFVLEKMPRATLPEIAGWERVRQKKYGATEVVFLQRSAEASNP